MQLAHALGTRKEPMHEWSDEIMLPICLDLYLVIFVIIACQPNTKAGAVRSLI